MSRYFINEAGERYDVPDEEVDSFLNDAKAEGLNIKEIPQSGETPKKHKFQNEAGEIYEVPEGEVEGFLRDAQNEGLKIRELSEKQDLGVWETLKTRKEAQFGKEMSNLETAVAATPYARFIYEMEQNRNEVVEQRLYDKSVDNPIELRKLGSSIGLDEAEMDRLYDEADSGLRTIAGFRRAPDMEVLKEGFRKLVEPRITARVKARQEAQEKLNNAEELGFWGKAALGTVEMGGAALEWATPIGVAAETSAAIINRTAELGKDTYTLDESGKAVVAVDENGNEIRGDKSEWAAVKAISGGAADAVIWNTPIVGKMLKKSMGRFIRKIPGYKEFVQVAGKGAYRKIDKLYNALTKSESGRILLKTGGVLAKVEEKLHVGSLRSMMLKSRVSELVDDVVGLRRNEGETKDFAEWLTDFVSVDSNVELLTGLLGVWAISAGGSYVKARGDIKKFRHGEGREETVAEYIGKEAAKRLSNKDLDMLYRVISSENLTAEKIEQFLDKVKADRAAAEKLIAKGKTLKEVSEAWARARELGSDGENALNALKSSLEARRAIDPEMEAKLDEKIAEYAEGQEVVAKYIKDDIVARLKDNRVFDDPEMLDEMVAMSARRFEPESIRLKIHDIRGTSMNEGQKISEIENLGVTDWQSAEQAGLTEKDRFGRYTGGAVRALNVIFHGTAKLQEGVKAGTVSGNLAENLLTAATCELGGRSAAERGELIDGILDRANGDEALADAMIKRLEADVDLNATVAEKLDRALTEAKAEVLKKRNPSASSDEVNGALVEPVEKPDGTITTTGEFVHGESGVNTERPMPSTPLEGVEEAPRLKGAELTFAPEGELKCQSFPEMRVNVSADGVALNNLSGVNIADPARSAEFAAVVAQVVNIAKRNGLRIIVAEEHKPLVQALTSEIQSEGLAKTQAKLDTRSKLFSLLFKTTLGTGVTYDEKSFVEALERSSNGRRLVNNHGEIYGFVDSDSVLHFNPAVMNFNTPIHEYGHLALDAVRKINPKLWEQGKKLIKDSEYYRSILDQSNDPENPYSWAKGNDDAICDEALATLIGDRGEKLVNDKGLESKLKAWLKEVWKAFKGAFGLADLTDEQVEKMTLEEFVDTINAELLSGREFGTKKKLPPSEKSVKRYDEAEGSGSNGLLRWRNDRGYLFAIPVDMERTQPGGKVVFATDDADITDWIQSTLNGYDLRLSKSGKLYVKGRNGLPDELALIFGRFPTIGGNDGLGLELANSTGIASYNLMTPDQLVASLKSDRANYDAWAKAKADGKSLDEARQEEHYADEAAREEAERKAHWENSGMGILDYIRSRMEDGDPEFDLDWEIAREMANDRADARFSIGGFHGALATGKVGLLREADKMEKGGASREEIWRTTGWWRGKDGKWRVELPDIKMRSKREIELAVKYYGNSISLSELVVAPELFKAYPALEETRIILDKDYFSSSTRGSFDPSSKDITLNGKGQISLADLPFVDRDAYDTATRKVSSDDFLNNWIELSKELGIKVGTFAEERKKAQTKIEEIEKRIVEKNRARLQSLDSDETRSILAHEIQHWIQENENFAKGGNVKTIREARALNKSLKEDIAKELNKAGYNKWLNRVSENVDTFLQTINEIREKHAGTIMPAERAFAETLDDEARTKVSQFLDKAEAIYNENAKEAHYGYTESEAYQSLLGEVEARNVQKRLDMSPEERAAVPPWGTEDVPGNRQIVRFSARPAMSALAKAKVGESVEGTTVDSLRNAIKTKIENGLSEGEFRFKKPEDRAKLVSEAVRFYKRFSQKTVMLSDGRCVYFVPDARAKAERGLSNDEAWAEYAIHAVTSSGQKIPGKDWNERLFNKTKAANIWRIENILKAERCEAKLSDDPEKLGVVFFGRGVDGRTIQIITRLDDRGNILADLSEVTVITGKKEKNLPPHKPLAEAVEAVAHKLRGGLLTVNENILPQNAANSQARFSIGGIFTGSTADYANRSRQGGVDDGPSLIKIGSGEGAQVYGYGLYGSDVRGVAEWYAKMDQRRKSGVFYKGEAVDFSSLDKDLGKYIIISSALDTNSVYKGKFKKVALSEYIKNLEKQLELFRQRRNEKAKNLRTAEQNEKDVKENQINAVVVQGIKKDLAELDNVIAHVEDALKDPESRYNEIGYSNPTGKIYEQTFFVDRPEGDESHLLKWYEPVSEEQRQWVADQLIKEGWNYVSFRDDNIRVDHKWVDGVARFQRVRGVDWSDITMDIFKFVPKGSITAMGETEQSAAGLAGAIEKRGALRPWTKADSPAANAKPIAFDAADMVMFWRAVSGSLRNPHVQKGERIKGRPNAIGLNIGGDRIEIVAKLFGVIDESDIKKLHEDCRAEGYFRNENTDWCAAKDKGAIEDERLRSQAELDRRTRELYKTRVETGAGGEHYATQVLGHEIGHTLGLLPTGAKLGKVGDATRTLYEAFESELKRQTGGLRVRRGEDNLSNEINKLIAWWHGTETMPEYYAKPKEKFAELFGIFLTQPESVQAQAPKAYDLCVKLIAGNEKLTKAYQTITSLKWDGKSNDAVMAEVRKTWDKEAQDQYRELKKLTKESISLKRDEFNYALNDRFGPMFAISTRALKAEKKLLDEAVRTGTMSEAEAADRYRAKQNEINALKTSLYDWQRQTGGQTRLMIAQFDDVKAQAEKDGVNWNDVRTYAHYMRVIEVGGRATAHGVDPARASAILDKMRQKLGDEKYLKVEKTWKAYRAVYEKAVLDDPNVRELFDADTMKMLEANKHYVTMRHRMGAEETGEWLEKIKAYKDGNSNAWDPCIDIQERLNKGLGSTTGESSAFVLYHLVGSFEATEDPLAATIRRAIEIKESAARNHLLKQTSETLRALGAKGVFDKVAGSKATKVDPNVYGKLFYMDGGVKHELIVPKIIYKSFKSESQNALPGFGAAMRAIRNTMTLWNPMFVNRAYLIDKSGLEANIKGLHKAPIDVLSEALCFRGIGVPLYMVNNYLARFTPICNTWIGKLLWNENTANHYAHKAQKIARIVYEGRFAERLEEARQLRALGETGRATEIEENVAIAQEMMRRNIFQSAYSFNKQQAGFDTDEIMRQFGYRIDGGKDPKSWKSKARNLGRWWTRFGEEQEAVTKIIAYLYELKKGTSAEEASRIAIERGGTPNLAARGVAASYIENATGFFWNVRKEATLRTLRAIKDHPTEWITKNFAQTAMPAFLKCMIITGGLEMIIRAMFDDDEEKIQNSWWAGEVVNYARFMNSAMKCVPGYYQRNYNIIPIAKFGDEVLSMRIKYSPEEFAIQNAIHTAFQKFGADPTDPDADWSSFNREMLSQITPDIFGGNYALDLSQILIGPIIGYNPYDRYRQRNVYDNSTWEARWSAPGNMATKMVTNFANYSPFGSFVTRFKDGQEQKIEDSDVPAWLDAVLQTPLLSRIPASMLSITSSDSYLKALANVDGKQKAYARIIAGDLLAECIENGRLGGFEEGLKDLPPELKRLAIRHVLNGWRQYHMDPNAKKLRTMRRIKDPNLKRKARKWIEDAEKYGD